MANLANFCFKYKAKINGKLTKCRILIELQQRTPVSYQVVTYVYEGIKIVDVLGSEETCYSFCKDIFFKSTNEKNIQRLIAEHH